ncbi:MAG: SURF1 family protein [Hyphomicrobiales bacterium]|nr:SURF1 family protein [Hyphomicrobiales bacterium]
MVTKPRGLFWPALATVLACTLLTSLGIWQLHRLKWKEALLAEIAARSHSLPQSPPAQKLWATLVPRDYDYRHVVLNGHYLPGDSVLVFDGDGPKDPHFSSIGYRLLEPLQQADGAIIIVNRGYVPGATPGEARRHLNDQALDSAAPEVTIVGVMRPPEPRNFFTPADDPATGRWFTRDPAEIARAEHLSAVAPFIVDEDVNPAPDGAARFPLPLQGAADIPNNHYQYALTWFGLALGILGMFISFVIKSLRGLV